MKNQNYLDFSEVQPTLDEVKGSANRMKNQNYLDFSEVQPTLDEVKGTKRSEK